MEYGTIEREMSATYAQESARYIAQQLRDVET